MERCFILLIVLCISILIYFILSPFSKNHHLPASPLIPKLRWLCNTFPARFRSHYANHMDDGELPVTPVGRLFLHPLTNQVIHCSFTLQFPIDVPSFKAHLRTSLMLNHPRFCSIMVRDSHGRERWRRTAVDIDRHVLVHCQPLPNDPPVSDEDAVNDFIADLSVSSPLPTDKPLWEIHLLLAQNTAVYRIHHALGDGISLMSMFSSGCREVAERERPAEAAPMRRRRRWSMWTLMMVGWYSLIYILELSLRILWVKDTTTVLSGGAGVELWPRKLASAGFQLDDMKLVKGAVDGATINDVLLGIISCGLSRYLDLTTAPQAKSKGMRITGLSMVNMRPEKGLMQDLSQLLDTTSGTRWGNIFWTLILPIYYDRGDSDPIQFVKRAKAMMDKKKLSIVAPFSYMIGHLIATLFGTKFVSILTYRSLCHTTFTVSNIVGPKEKITLAKNPVKCLRISTTSLPHAITMHMVSYAGVADLQILVAKEVIFDPKVLAQCFKDALFDMKQAAALASRKELATS